MLPEFTKGIIRENPLFVQLLGVCPALATTSSLTNALGMGVGQGCGIDFDFHV